MQAPAAFVAWVASTPNGGREMARTVIQPRPMPAVSRYVQVGRDAIDAFGSPEAALANWLRTGLARTKSSIAVGMYLMVSRKSWFSSRLRSSCTYLFALATLYELRPELDGSSLQRGCLRNRARHCRSVQRDEAPLVRPGFRNPLAPLRRSPQLSHQGRLDRVPHRSPPGPSSRAARTDVPLDRASCQAH